MEQSTETTVTTPTPITIGSVSGVERRESGLVFPPVAYVALGIVTLEIGRSFLEYGLQRFRNAHIDRDSCG